MSSCVYIVYVSYMFLIYIDIYYICILYAFDKLHYKAFTYTTIFKKKNLIGPSWYYAVNILTLETYSL